MTVIFILFIFLPFLLWAASGLKKIDVGWKGQRLLLGKRIKGSEVGEGWQWAAWPWEIKVADGRQTIMNLGNVEAITRDNTKVTIGCTIVYRITNLDSYFDVEPSEIKKGLDEARTEVVRSFVREETLEGILSLHQQLGSLVKNAVEHEDWGIDIVKVIIPEILPEKTMADALALKKKEELEKVGQAVEAVNLGTLISFFSGTTTLNDKDGNPVKGPSLPVELAYEAALIHLGKTEAKKIASNTLGLDKGTVAAIVEALTNRRNG